GGLAGNDLHHPHADDRQGSGQVLGQVGDLADLDPRRGLDLEAGDDRTRLYLLDLGLDTEVLELEVEQPRQALHRLRQEALVHIARRTQQGNGGQRAGDHRLDILRRLTCLLGPHAGFRRAGFQRFYLRRRTLFLGRNVLLQRLLALGTGKLGLAFLLQTDHRFAATRCFRPWGRLRTGSTLLPPADPGATEQIQQIQGDAPDQVHDLEPGQIGEDGQPEQEQGEKQQGAALHVEYRVTYLAQQLTQYATGPAPFGKTGRRPAMQRGQRGTGQQRQYETDQTPGEQPAVPNEWQMAAAEHLPHLDRHYQGEQIGQIAQHQQQHIGDPGAHASTGILHRQFATAAGPARVGGVITE